MVEMTSSRPLGLGIEHGGRLIEYDAARPHGDDSRDGHALLLPAGEQVRRVQTVVIHPDELQCLVHASADFLRGNAEVLRRKGNILFYDVGDHLIIGILEHHADRAADVDQKRLVGRVHAEYLHTAALRQEDRVKMLCQRGFAAAVVAEDGDKAALLDG